jgi:dihydrofolate synthase/folylpolyglutamate synthase
MNKFDSFSYLSSLNIDVMRLGLEAITDLLSRMGNPQNSYKTILVAGTNGKGSTATMIASVLRSAGYKVGLYTSPHLVDIRERIVINGKKIAKEDFNQIIADIKDKKSFNLFRIIDGGGLCLFSAPKSRYCRVGGWFGRQA